MADNVVRLRHERGRKGEDAARRLALVLEQLDELRRIGTRAASLFERLRGEQADLEDARGWENGVVGGGQTVSEYCERYSKQALYDLARNDPVAARDVFNNCVRMIDEGIRAAEERARRQQDQGAADRNVRRRLRGIERDVAAIETASAPEAGG